MCHIITRSNLNISIDGVSSAIRSRLWARSHTSDTYGWEQLLIKEALQKQVKLLLQVERPESGPHQKIYFTWKYYFWKNCPWKNWTSLIFRLQWPSTLNHRAKSQFKSPCNHETPTPISHRRAEVTSGDVCNTTQCSQQWHAAIPVTPLSLVPCNSLRPAGHFFTHSLNTQLLYRAESQWGPRGQLSGSPDPVHGETVLWGV